MTAVTLVTARGTVQVTCRPLSPVPHQEAHMTTQTLPAASVPATEIEHLETFQKTLPTSSTLRHALSKITDDLKSGSDLVVASGEETLTPSQAAKILGISRGHLYKVLDSGALAFDIVGERDRRINQADLVDYQTRLQRARAEQARDLARRDSIEDELLDHMD
jgi:excisionase family DNA binding protein